MRVVVVGGGIVGLACAYYLGRRGATVTVLERSALGSGSTDRANGGIRAQFTSPVSIRLSRESIAVWERFEATFDVDIEYVRSGYLFLARTPETADRLRDNVAVQREYDVPSAFLDPVEAGAVCPRLHAHRYEGAAYSPDDGFADPHLALEGFKSGATAAGADIRTNVAVTDVRLREGRVVGVQTTEGRIPADMVVNATGAWASRVAAMAGIDLPVTPKRRQLVVVDPEHDVPRDVPLTVDMDADSHFRPERDGRAVVGGFFASEDPPANPDGYPRSMDFGWATTALERVAEVAGYFGPESRIRRGWAGLYAVTPDHHPIIEETQPGFVNAVGFSGHGFMQAPATGQIVAELVHDGSASLVDISMLGADRFERGELLAEGTVID